MDLVSFVLNLPSNSDFFFNYQGIENMCVGMFILTYY